jgi:hypothetical protein
METKAGMLTALMLMLESPTNEHEHSNERLTPYINTGSALPNRQMSHFGRVGLHSDHLWKDIW